MGGRQSVPTWNPRISSHSRPPSPAPSFPNSLPTTTHAHTHIEFATTRSRAQVWQAADCALPGLGTRYLLQPGHCDPTFNMYDWVLGVRGGVVEHVWPVRGRGPGA